MTLTGTATQASISLPTNFAFGSQLAGTPFSSVTSQPVNVINSSTGPLAGGLTVTGTSLTGPNSGDFHADNGCTSPLTPPGGTCAIQLKFAPAPASSCGSGSARSATLILQDNAPGSPQSITLSGTAMDFCFGSATGQPASAPIQPGQSATYALEIESSAGFTGSVSLACAGAPPAGTCTITTTPPSTPPAVQVSPNAPGQFQVVVTTTAVLTPPGKAARRKSPPWTALRPTWWLMIVWLALLAVWAVRSFGPRTSVPRNRCANFAKAAQVGALLAALAFGMAACGGGGASDPPTAGTPAGTYTVMLTATGPGGVTRTIPLSLTVQ